MGSCLRARFGCIDEDLKGLGSAVFVNCDKGLAEWCLNRIGIPSDIANAVTFLCSDVSIFMTGQIISVNGGYTMVG